MSGAADIAGREGGSFELGRKGEERPSALKVLSICTVQRPIPLTLRLADMTAELHGFDALTALYAYKHTLHVVSAGLVTTSGRSMRSKVSTRSRCRYSTTRKGVTDFLTGLHVFLYLCLWPHSCVTNASVVACE